MIQIYNLIVGYHGRKVSPSISGYIKKGNMIAVMGSNGTGKSTFLKTLARLLPPISGQLKFIKKNKYNISYLPQYKNINYHFPITVFDVVSMGCWPKISFLKKINHDQKYLIWKALDEMKLLNLLHQDINSLSEGQLQCMLFARILVQKAPLILLDEPFQGIDTVTCKILMNSINQLNQKGCTIIAVLHDYKYVSDFFSSVLLFNKSISIWKYLFK